MESYLHGLGYGAAASEAVFMPKSLFATDNSMLKANVAGTPVSFTVPEQTMVGRQTGGLVTALTQAQIHTLLFGSNSVNENVTLANGKSLYTPTIYVNSLYERSAGNNLKCYNNIQLLGDDKVVCLYNDVYSSAGVIYGPCASLRRGRGTFAAKAAVNSGDVLGRTYYYGYGTNTFVLSAYIEAVALETFTNATAAGRLHFATAVSGAVLPSNKMYIDSSVWLANSIDLLAEVAGASDVGSPTKYLGHAYFQQYHTETGNGADGTFTTADGKTVTVDGGIITSIV